MAANDSSKDEGNETSSYVFLATFLIIVLIILLLKILKRFFYKLEYDNSSYHNCICSKCKARAIHLRQKAKEKNINKYLYLYMLLFVIASYAMYICSCEIIYSSPKGMFDPYALLEIKENASNSEIKKAYKKLALKYHPDKNKAENAKEQFMLISKAYKSLATEQGRKNFLRYGDPDGPSYYHFNLPSFMTNKKFSNIVIGVFIAFILIILPISFLRYMSNSNKYTESGMLIVDQSIFYHYLNDNSILTEIPFILGLAVEFDTMAKVSEDEIKTIETTYQLYNKYMPKHSIKKIPLNNQKAICLLYSYYFNCPIKLKNYENDLNTILPYSSFLLKYMIQMCFECTLVAPLANNEIKSFGNTINVLIKMMQSLHQQSDISQIDTRNDSITELPHITNTIINAHPNMKSIKSINDLLSLSQEDRENQLNASSLFTKEQITDITIALNNIPQYDIKINAQLEDVQFSNIITFQGDITIKNISNDKTPGIRHSVSYPDIFIDELAICITLNGKLIDMKQLTLISLKSAFKYTIISTDAGLLNYNVEVYSLNYKGIDQTIPFVLKSNLEEKNKQQYTQKLSRNKVEYFNYMFKQEIPYLTYSDEVKNNDDSKQKTD